MLTDDLVHPDVLDPSGLMAANDARIDALLEHLGDLGDQRFLEVGCSDGWNLLNAIERGALAWGVDSSAALLWLARDRLPDADLRLGTPTELPFDSGSFDVVCRYFVTDCGRDLAASIGEMARVCRRGGVVAVIVSGSDDVDAEQRAAAVQRTATGLGMSVAQSDTAAHLANAELIPSRAVILTR